jgi:hypothetical protein
VRRHTLSGQFDPSKTLVSRAQFEIGWLKYQSKLKRFVPWPLAEKILGTEALVFLVRDGSQDHLAPKSMAVLSQGQQGGNGSSQTSLHVLRAAAENLSVLLHRFERRVHPLNTDRIQMTI